MSEDPAPKPTHWLPYAGLLLTVAGMVYQGGVLSASVENNTRRIVALEVSDNLKNAAINAINERGGRNETKLDFLVEEAQNRQRNRP